MPETLKVALIQQRCSGSRPENLDRTLSGLEEAVRRGADLALLPELHALPYPCQTEDPALFDLAEPLDGPTGRFLAQAAKRFGIVLVGSLFERRAPGLYHNTAVVFERDGTLAGIYRKMHIPDDPGYYEKFYFAPGDLGFEPIPTSVGRLGVLVCWDQWFPEAARMMTLKGADLLLYPTAIGFDPREDEEEQRRQLEAWQTVQRGHAIANGIFLLCCNRVGFEPDRSGQTAGIRFWGSSFIAGPQGEFLARAADQETVLSAELDGRRMEEVRRIWPFLRDRRIDAYGDLLRRFSDPLPLFGPSR